MTPMRLGIALVAALLDAGAAAPGRDPQAAGSIPDLSGKILTVTGVIDPAALGTTLMHEHLLIERESLGDLPAQRGVDPALYGEPLSLANLSAHRNARALPTRENRYNTDDLTSVEDAIQEVLSFKRLGGDAIVDVTNIGLNRNPEALRRISEATGLKIVMGAGCYRPDFIRSLDMEKITEQELAERIVGDIAVGVQESGVRSGIIGEVAVDGNPLKPLELKSLRAAGRASRRTGAAVTLHNGGTREEKFTVIEMLEGLGVEPARVVMGHSNNLAEDIPFVERLLARGVYVQFDLLGMSIGARLRPLGSVDDARVARAVVELVRAGHGDRILLSQDVCTKLQLRRYGGRGFSYVSEFFLPELRRLGLSREQVRRIVVENPRRVLTFVSPRAELSR